jgi:hypothetical protein
MSLTTEDNILRWTGKKKQGSTFTAADISKDTGIPPRNIGKVLSIQPEGTFGYDDGIWTKN